MLCEHENDSRFGWICHRCSSAISPDLNLCPICNDFEEDEECIHAQQDDLLRDNELFEGLVGN